MNTNYASLPRTNETLYSLKRRNYMNTNYTIQRTDDPLYPFYNENDTDEKTAEINTTNSKIEKHVDGTVGYFGKRIQDFAKYLKSSDSNGAKEVAQYVAYVALAVFAIKMAPVTFALATLAGAAAGSFSANQINGIKENFNQISNQLSIEVKAAAVVATSYCLPILFPALTGLYFGLNLGAKIDPFQLASLASRVEKNLNDGDSYVRATRGSGNNSN